ncbi:MAG: lysylphosphatidylglycerol synthase transmembrane domain-containing protein [Candidatus Helarchaeota archaeon]
MKSFIKKHKNILINFVSLILFIFLVLYVVNNLDIFEVIKNISLSDFLLVSLATIIIVIINAILNHSLLLRLNDQIRFSDSLLLQFANNLLNKITPHTGIIFRGFYFKNVYNLDLSKYLATIAGVYIISFGLNALVGLISSYIIYEQSGIYNIAIIIFLSFITLFTAILMFFSPVINNRDGFVRRNLGKMIDGWNIIKTNPIMVVFFIFTSILITSFSVLQQYFSFRSIGTINDITSLFYLSSLSNLTLLISITPSGIGIRESIYAFSSEVVNIDINILLLSSLLTRVITFFTSCILGGLSYLILTKKIKKP